MHEKELGFPWDFVRFDLTWTQGTHIAWTLGVVEGCPQSGKVFKTCAKLYISSSNQLLNKDI